METPTTVAIGVSRSKSKSSMRAVKWALENNRLPHFENIILIHVMPLITKIPTPSGKNIPISEMEADIVSIYRQDMKSQCDEIFITFKRLCKTKNVVTLVLEDDNPADALLRCISERGCTCLVLGYSSSNYFSRKLKGPDIPSAVLKNSPSTCDIYVVAKTKLLMKTGNSIPITGDNVGQGAFPRIQSGKDMDKSSKRTLHCNDVDSKSSKDLEGSAEKIGDFSSQAYPYGFSSTSTVVAKRHLDFGSEASDVPMVVRHTSSSGDSNQAELQEELVQMQLELQNTLVLYDQACGDLVHVQKKVQSLSYECFEDARRVSDVLNREEMLKKTAAKEKLLHLEAMKEVEVSKEVLAKEAQERQKAELAAFVESWKKQEIRDALFTKDKRYRKYTREEIEYATDFFSDDKKIGEGGYGKVYRCTLDHTPVAIKVFRSEVPEKKNEFLREVEILSQLRHPHLVLLLAACPEIGCLVYEYMENGSLEERLFCRKDTPPLPWVVRFQIAVEVASGLAFLHSSKPEPIVHCDLKPGNILLDRNYVSKIGDVGLAQLLPDVVPDSVTQYGDSVLSGTLHYMDPEYQRTGIIRPKSDVYAFGVIILQLLTARHPKGLIFAVENAIRSGCFGDILDKSVSGWPLTESEELASIALKCLNLRCRDRPDLEYEVLPMLKKLQATAYSSFQLQQDDFIAPSHYFCPILQEIMDDPYIAADSITYEYIAIKAWLEKYNVSPVTRLMLPHTVLTPNTTLLSSIQEWRKRKTF